MEELSTYLGGKVEMSVGTLTIGPEFLGDITPNFAEGTLTTNSQAGVITRPSGKLDTAQLEGTYILPSMDALKVLYADIYEEPLTDGLLGRIRIGGGTCKTKIPKAVNIHFTCDSNSDNDLHIFAGLVQLNLNYTYGTDGNIEVPFTILAQPTSNGYAIAGAGDLTQKTLWDPTTQTWVPVEESE